MSDKLEDKVMGCIIGSAIGDAFGAVSEGRSREDFIKYSWNVEGKEWLEDFVPSSHKPHPEGIWVSDAPRGTGTDDTRFNNIFIECVVKNKGIINPHLLAFEYIERYRNMEKYVPGYFTNEDIEKLALPFYRTLYRRACIYLGNDAPELYEPYDSEERVPRYVINESAGYGDFPNISGLISLQSAGLLYSNEPEKAYKKAYELSTITDMGYARDATAMLAATVSAALNEKADPLQVLERGIKTNPFGLRNRRMMANQWWQHHPQLHELFKMADDSRDGKELILKLARACDHLHLFDPFDVLGVPLTVIRYCRGDPVRSIVLAANHRKVDGEGRLVRFRDTDCTAMVAGTIVGAINGLSSFPKDWIRDTIEANKKVYNIDLEKNSKAFYAALYQ
jgi:ADP-ribosylglycohydrolase